MLSISRKNNCLTKDDKALLSLVQMCDMIDYSCFCSWYVESMRLGQLQTVYSSVILRTPAWCKINVIYHWMAVNRMLCGLEKADCSGWANNELNIVSRVGFYVHLTLNTIASPVIHSLAYHCTIKIYRSPTIVSQKGGCRTS